MKLILKLCKIIYEFRTKELGKRFDEQFNEINPPFVHRDERWWGFVTVISDDDDDFNDGDERWWWWFCRLPPTPFPTVAHKDSFSLTISHGGGLRFFRVVWWYSDDVCGGRGVPMLLVEDRMCGEWRGEWWLMMDKNEDESDLEWWVVDGEDRRRERSKNKQIRGKFF